MTLDTYPSTEAEHVRAFLVIRDEIARDLVERCRQEHRND